MDWTQLKLGFALTGSFCTFAAVLPQLESLSRTGAEIFPILSAAAATCDTRFGKAADFREKIEKLCNKKAICTIAEAEPFGPKKLVDAIVIAPCTGNTLAKIANGITDSTVTMAAKAVLRNNCPVVIAPSSNDALSANAKNLGTLLNMKNVYFVPFGQDDPFGKNTSLVAKMELIMPSVEAALKQEQLQPVLR